MKKKMLAATLLMGLLAACGGNSASIVGSWVEPVPGMEGQVQGIKMEEGALLLLSIWLPWFMKAGNRKELN